MRALVGDLTPAGKYSVKWDGCDQNGQPVARGIYFYRLEAGEAVATRKLVIVQ